MTAPVWIIGNPTAAGGRARARWRAAERRLRDQGIGYEFSWTNARGHATQLARQAVAAGATTVAAFGGDGTLHEVVQGLVKDDADPRCAASVAFLPAGSSCDFDRELPPRQSWEARLRNPRVLRRDLLRVRCHDDDGRPVVRYAVLGSHVGLVAEAARRVNLSRMRTLPVDLVALAAAVGAFRARLRPTPTTMLRHGSEEPRLGRLLDTAVVLTPRLSGGMRLGVPISGDEGRFVTLEVDAVGATGLARVVSALYRGRLAEHPGVRWRRGETVEMSGPVGALVEADGEIVGRTPARWSVVPGALPVAVAR
ncbi:diacylglycerol kinase family protein [Micromonospora sp. 4G55]|uniref:diacylglycerol/lipid kinase family protein n=1 Tax=Micromonospora sp. 4G55 TaxID=2806102 RepID=UPI001A569DC7|nr:diacylglycerol kinase family protein [Micromonospora sp. 4G55]MBM0255469.1 hypothetical protein [Micromonospora sp. 4G55]